jgi:thioredoxin 1
LAENIVHVTENDFEGVVIKSNIPVLVDFWAVWCGPCHMILQALENIADSYKDKIRVARINVDENRIISSKYGIMSIPTLLLFKNGEIKETIIGVFPQPKIEEKIKTYL